MNSTSEVITERSNTRNCVHEFQMTQRKNPITLSLLRLISIAPMVAMTLDHPKIMYVDLWYAGEHQENILGAVSRRYRDSPQKYPIDTDPVKAVPIVGPTSFPNSDFSEPRILDILDVL